MNPKAKKAFIISGIALDVLVTIFLFVLSLIIIIKMPATKAEAMLAEGFIGWFQQAPIRIIFIVVLPLALLLAINIFITFKYLRGSGSPKKKPVSLNDLSDEEKEALRKKILQEMLEENNNK